MLVRTDGRPFTPLSIEATEFYSTDAPLRMALFGVKSGGPPVETVIALDGTKGFERFDLSRFTNVQSVSFGGRQTGPRT